MKSKDGGLLASFGKRILGFGSASNCCTLRDAVEPATSCVAADSGELVAEAEASLRKAAPDEPACCAPNAPTSSRAGQSA